MSAKAFFIGLSAGLAAGYFAQALANKNQEELQEILDGLPKSFKLGSGLDLDELLAQKNKLEELIKQKAEDLKRYAAEKKGKSGDSDPQAG
ncbi:MAG: hypothetical protein A2527_05275 [Candidatus Lambdaproteobacteria bacterium RIFOXYD2_FULL_50_16]|uniref:YtxH domain-containing protein n=1 Tax=Candidatus Lambdaproteobacteria bacterium RIFOXYD2_FULL_50_16 TaxID=1817772 RepID=A0A1F6G900_9PROT|nr:MAG: hypothetical protein A2527_05275 [Candidatus Lambdaproteobacteria bacterium RIFOXYD2_FULL_50_16]